MKKIHDSLYDADRNGQKTSRDGPLVVIPDLIVWHMLYDLPMVPAVELVRDALLGKVPDLPIYITQPRHYAHMVTDADVWQEARPFRPKSVEMRPVRGFVHSWDGAARRKPVAVPEQQERPRLAGSAHLLSSFFKYYRDSATTEAKLYAMSIRRGIPAILEADAEELFGFNIEAPKLMEWADDAPPAVTSDALAPRSVQEAGETHPAVTKAGPFVGLVSTQPLNNPSNVLALEKRSAVDRREREQKARAQFKRAKNPADDWAPRHFAELLRQFEALTLRGPGALQSSSAHALLAEIWGLQPNSVKTYLTTARTKKAAGALPACNG